MKRCGGYFTIDNVYAHGSNYGPLLSNGKEYLCPDCGGYKSYENHKMCPFCKGKGTISLRDKRIYCSKTLCGTQMSCDG